MVVVAYAMPPGWCTALVATAECHGEHDCVPPLLRMYLMHSLRPYLSVGSVVRQPYFFLFRIANQCDYPH